jgi:hypothetical protein
MLGYEVLEARLPSRSADILDWYLSSGNPSANTIYIEEKFCVSCFRWLVGALATALVVGGGVFVYFRGYDSATQNWLGLAAIVIAVVLVGLVPQRR